MTPNSQDLVQYTKWLRFRITEQGDMDPLGESEGMVKEYLETLDVLTPPKDDPYWIAGRDSRGCIRLRNGQGMHIANPENTPAEIQGWYDRATEKKWRKTYGAALDLLDREEGR